MPGLTDLFCGSSEKRAVCIIDTGTLRARGTMLVNERLRTNEKDEAEEEEEEG